MTLTKKLREQLKLFVPSSFEDGNVNQSFAGTVAEYFAGIGLVRLGLERAGWKILFANDFDEKKKEMYLGYFKNANSHYDSNDVFSLDSHRIPHANLATSSFPCVDLSVAGNRNGLNGKHSSAFWGFINILQQQGENKPSLVMLENVPHWLRSNEGKDFRITIDALNKLGYACDVVAIDALRFTPQSRTRIFVFGIQTTNPNRDMGILMRRSDSLSTSAMKETVLKNKDLDWNFLNIPAPPPRKKRGLSQIIEKMDANDSRWWGQDDVNRHVDMMAEQHLRRLNELQVREEISYRTIYRRKRKGGQRAEMRKGDTAGCLRTARGGSSRQIIVRVGANEILMRHMTPREYARLQGVPENYPIPENTIQALNGFGDAVCVPVITWIAENVLNPAYSELLRLRKSSV